MNDDTTHNSTATHQHKNKQITVVIRFDRMNDDDDYLLSVKYTAATDDDQKKEIIIISVYCLHPTI